MLLKSLKIHEKLIIQGPIDGCGIFNSPADGLAISYYFAFAHP